MTLRPLWLHVKRFTVLACRSAPLTGADRTPVVFPFNYCIELRRARGSYSPSVLRPSAFTHKRSLRDPSAQRAEVARSASPSAPLVQKRLFLLERVLRRLRRSGPAGPSAQRA